MSSSSKSTETSRTVSTPTNAPYVDSLFSGLAGQIQGLSGRNPLDFVAGSNSLLDLAGENAYRMNNVGGADYAGYVNANPDLVAAAQQMGMTPTEYGKFHYENFGQKEGRALPTVADPWAKAESMWNFSPAQAEFVSGTKWLDEWMNPYRREVKDVALRDFDVEAGRKRAEAERILNGNDAFSGSGGALSWLGLDDNLDRSRSALETDLLDRMFNQSAGYALTDAGNENQVNMFNAGQSNSTNIAKASGFTGLTGAKVANQTQNLGLLGDIGMIQRDIEQQQRAAPLSLLGFQAATAGGLPWNLFHGGVEEGTATGKLSKSDPAGTAMNIAKAAAAAATLFSDARLKEDVETIGHDSKGRRWVSYRYRWDEPDVRHEGVMAQEVVLTDPHAVSVHPSGYLMVNYGELR